MHCAKPARIRSGWPIRGFFQTHLVRKQAGVQESSGPGFWQNATGPLPVSHFQTGLPSSTDGPERSVQNQPGSDLVLADCVRFRPNGSGPEARRCERILRQDGVREASDQRFWSDPDGIRIGSAMFYWDNAIRIRIFYCPSAVQVYKEICLAVHNNKQNKQQTTIFK